MNLPHIIFPVGPGGSSPLTAAARIRLFALSTFIYERVGENPSACWYAMRCHYIHGPSCFVLEIGGSRGTFDITLLPAHETRLLALFLLDNLAVKPAFDPEQIIVPASIRHGLGVFSCR